MKERRERFPGIDWYCDRCGHFLNSQDGFTDHKYIWKCTYCGYKNSISRTNIIDLAEEYLVIRHLGIILGFIRCFCVYAALAYISSLLIGTQEGVPEIVLGIIRYATYALPFLIILSMIFERGIAKYGEDKLLIPWIITSIFYYIFDDLIRPFTEFISSIIALFSFSWHISVLFTIRKVFFTIRKLLFGLLYGAIVACFVYFMINTGTANALFNVVQQVVLKRQV